MSKVARLKSYHADDDAFSDNDIARTALERSLLTQDEWTACQAIQDRQLRRAQYQSLLEILVQEGALTQNQIDRIAQQLRQAAHVGEIPGYQILAKLGQGAMGVVYKAMQLSVERVVALKILSRHLGRNKDFITILDREAKIGARLCCEHIPQIFDRGEVNGQHYLVMEFVEGVSVAHQLDGGKEFSETEAVEIALALAGALDHLHRHNIVHRDVKPANVVITRESIVKLMDLGLARHCGDWRRIAAEEGTAIGTPFYISPEQIRGQRDLDSRSDLYSLGATLYHMVTGQPPFVRHASVEVLDAHLRIRPTPPRKLRSRLSETFNNIVLKLLAKSPERRFAEPADVLKQLQRLQADHLRSQNGQPKPQRGLFGKKQR
jgi:serine/threonine protein kinase